MARKSRFSPVPREGRQTKVQGSFRLASLTFEAPPCAHTCIHTRLCVCGMNTGRLLPSPPIPDLYAASRALQQSRSWPSVPASASAGSLSCCVSSYLPGSCPEAQPVSIFWGICKRLSCQRDPIFLAPKSPILIKPQTALAFASAAAGEGRHRGWGRNTPATCPGQSRGQAKVLIWCGSAQESLAMPIMDSKCQGAGDPSLASGFYWKVPQQPLWHEL